MSNPMPIYSQVVPKSQYRAKGAKVKERPQNLARTDFDPLNYNHGGNFQMLNSPTEPKMEPTKQEKRETRRKDESSRRRAQAKPESSEGKVEAYLRQNQVSMRQQQHRHSAVRQAEHRVNLRSLPLNEVPTSRGHDRTPTDKQRGFPREERDRETSREHRRERDRDRDRERDRENFVFDGTPLSPITSRQEPRSFRKSTSSHKMSDGGIVGDKRRFFCREWMFQKLAHCLEQRSGSKTAGVLVLGDAGSGKTAICQELSEPGQSAQARQQRALNRRLLARHLLQSDNENSLKPAEFIRSLAMQLLSHSSRRNKPEQSRPTAEQRSTLEEDLAARFQHLCDDGEESSKPLLADSEDQHTDSDDGNRTRTIDRIHERESYLDAMVPDAVLSSVGDLPEIHPRSSLKPTNPFLSTEEKPETRLYENHENLFLRNISQRQSKDRNSRLLRQSSEPLTEKKPSGLQKSLSTEQEDKKETNKPIKSRIPVANFRAKTDSKPTSLENSPQKKKDKPLESEPVEYQNVLNPPEKNDELKDEDKKMDIDEDDVPPPIPSLPVNPRTLIANAYYAKLLADPEIQQALLPNNLEKSPDECFKKALLFPLLEIDPPKQCLFLIVDAIDEGGSLEDRDSTQPSQTIGQLLNRHQHLLPPWLLLVVFCRRIRTKAFTGFRKITIDELSRAHVSADVQRYVLSRLDTEPRLRSRVSSDTSAAAAAAAALDHLRIKSDGCLLYLEKVLDGVADGFIALREIREIPGTLNGLYLWLAQRLFHGRRFTKVRLLLDVLLAARCGLTEEMLYRCLLTKEYSLCREGFRKRLHLLRRILVIDRSTGHLSIFHHSFAKWLVDVKHCTRRYLCCVQDGHAALSMYYTLEANRLSALEIHNYIYHMNQLEAHLLSQKKNKTGSSEVSNEPVDLHTLMLLWLLDSGCDVESAMKRDSHDITQTLENGTAELEVNSSTETADERPGELSPLESIMPELCNKDDASVWCTDARVLRTLRELTAKRSHEVLDPSPQPEPPEDQIPEDVMEDIDPAIIHELAANGDDEKLLVLLKRNPSAIHRLEASTGVTSQGARTGHAGWSALRAAAWAGHVKVVDLLLEYGCDVDAVDADNRTALRAAAWSGHLPVVTRLLAAGAAPDKQDAEGRTPLIAAAYMGHADIVAALITAGADIDHADADGRTALSVAALCASGADCTSVLLERGADPNKADRDGATPLLVAAFEGHTETCELLLEAEASPEHLDNLGRSALWAAAAAGRAAPVRALLFWGAGVDTVDSAGRTVLSVAAAQGNVEVVRQLLDRGLDEQHRDNSGWTPLHYAAFEGHIEVCEALLEAGAKVDDADNDGKSPLMLAAQEGHSALAQMLIDEWAARVDLRAHDGKTAFRLAALEGHFPCVSLLIDRGADVDAVDCDGRSALYALALDDRRRMARYLVTACRARLDVSDAEGRTPLHVSAWQGHDEMVKMLITVGGASVDARDRCLRTALHAAAWRGRTNALRTLLSHGAQVAAHCAQGATPLGIAAQEGHEDCVLILLQHGADPLQADHCGRTPAKVAWRAGHASICRLLEQWAAPPAPSAPPPPAAPAALAAGLEPVARQVSPENKRRSVHSSNSTKSSSNLTTASVRSHDIDSDVHTHEKGNRANLSLSFTQQVARCRGRRERDREIVNIPENDILEKNQLRSYAANERDAELHKYACERDSERDWRHGCERDSTSPLYASPPRSPVSDVLQNLGSQPPSLTTQPVVSDTHFNRDTHMRIILGRENKPSERNESKNKRNGIVTNPAMRLVANVRNGLDNAAANIRRTGNAIAASASSSNPAVKTNAFQWRKETPL